MTGENKRANIASELGRADESMRAARVQTGRMDPQDARLFARIQKYRLEADYGRDFVLTDAALREDLASCQGFLDRATGGSDGGCKSLRPADVSFGLSFWPTVKPCTMRSLIEGSRHEDSILR